MQISKATSAALWVIGGSIVGGTVVSLLRPRCSGRAFGAVYKAYDEDDDDVGEVEAANDRAAMIAARAKYGPKVTYTHQLVRKEVYEIADASGIVVGHTTANDILAADKTAKTEFGPGAFAMVASSSKGTTPIGKKYWSGSGAGVKGAKRRRRRAR